MAVVPGAKMKVESWLTTDDIARCWKVIHGELPETFVSLDELNEFTRVIDETVSDPTFVRSKQGMH